MVPLPTSLESCNARRAARRAVHHRQAETGALAERFGGKERLDRPLRASPASCRCRYPRFVAADSVPGRRRSPRADVRLIDANLDRAALGHGVARVDREIQTASSSWLGIDAAGGRFRQIEQTQCIARPERALQEIAACRWTAHAQIHRRGFQILLSRKCKHALSQRCAALRRPAWPRRSSAGYWRSSGRRLRRISRLPITAINRLLKSCATPPVSCPIALHFLRLQQLLLSLSSNPSAVRSALDALLQRARQRRQARCAPPRVRRAASHARARRALAGGDVRRHADQAIYPAVGVPERAGADVDPMLRAVRANVAVFDDVVGAGLDGLLQHLAAARSRSSGCTDRCRSSKENSPQGSHPK